jgi:hypothetical protein
MTLEDDPQLRARVQKLLDHCELTNVRLVEFTAKRHDIGREPVSAKVASETAYVVDDSLFANRYVWQVNLIDEDENSVAELAATLVVEYDVFDGFEPDSEAADAVANTTGYFAAYPYVRELFQSQTARLQLNPVVLGMLLRGSSQPRAVSTP